MGLTDDDVREILRIIDESELDELRIDMPGFRLHVRRGGAPAPEPAEPDRGDARAGARGRAAPPEPAPPANGAATIDAPMLGTFYRASAPGEHAVRRRRLARSSPTPSSCLIEVMKMMNSVKAGVRGTVVEVCADERRARRVRRAAVPGRPRRMTIARVFVANRGEIAVRIVRACRALGLEAVVGVSDVDRDSAAARLADRAVCIGPARATESYLQARDDRAGRARHRLRRDPPRLRLPVGEPAPRARSRARRASCSSARRAEVIELAGDKLARARGGRRGRAAARARRRGRDARRTPSAFAAESGYPVLLKAAGGGGGRGIKLARDAGRAATRSSASRSPRPTPAFGDPRLYVERFVAAARHVEVQIAADAHGAVVHLGERDCSVQRRYQKVIEEAPAPSITAEQRAALTDGGGRLRARDRLRATSGRSSSWSTPRPASTSSSSATAASRSSTR